MGRLAIIMSAAVMAGLWSVAATAGDNLGAAADQRSFQQIREQRPIDVAPQPRQETPHPPPPRRQIRWHEPPRPPSARAPDMQAPSPLIPPATLRLDGLRAAYSPRSLVIDLSRNAQDGEAVRTIADMLLGMDVDRTKAEFIRVPNLVRSYGRANGVDTSAYLDAYGGWAAKNEFDRAAIQQRFFAQVLEPRLRHARKPPLEVTILYPVTLGEYDGSRFPVAATTSRKNDYETSIGVPGINKSVILDLSGRMPESLPMDPQSARALITEIKNRRLFLSAGVRFSGIGTDRYGRPSMKGEVVDAAFYRDQAHGRFVAAVGAPEPPDMSFKLPPTGNLVLPIGVAGDGTNAQKVLTILAVRTNGFSGRMGGNNEAAFTRAFAPAPLYEQYFDTASRWITRNELELVRLRQRFQTDVVQPVIDQAPKLPVEMSFLWPMQLGTYDGDSFPLSSSSRSFTTTIRLSSFGYPEVRIGLPGSPPTDLPMPPPQAEALLSTAGNRAVYLRVDALLTHMHGDLLTGRIRRATLFADVETTRPVASFGDFDDVRPAMLGHGDRLEPRGPLSLTPETLDLLTLRNAPQALDEERWTAWLNRRLQVEQTVGRADADASDDPWGPFFPVAFSQREVTQQTRDAFRSWSLARAAGLPDRYRFRQELFVEAGKPSPVYQPARSGEILVPLGRQIAPCTPIMRLPEEAGLFTIDLTEQQLGRQSSTLRLSGEYDLVGYRLAQGKCTLDMRPVRVIATTAEGNSLATIEMGRAEIAAIEAKRQAAEDAAAAEAAKQEQQQRELAVRQEQDRQQKQEAQRRALAEASEAAGARYDILGIKLGMTPERAEEIAREHLGEVVALAEPGMGSDPSKTQFDHGRLFVQAQTGEQIGLYLVDGVVAGVFRHLDLAGKSITYGDLNAILNEKYGEPTLGRDRKSAWIPGSIDARGCAYGVALSGNASWTDETGKGVQFIRQNDRLISLYGIRPFSIDCGVILTNDVSAEGPDRPARSVDTLLLDTRRRTQPERSADAEIKF